MDELKTTDVLDITATQGIAENDIAENQTQNFPTAPNAEGFYYETPEDKEIGVQTKTYENGSIIKKVLLPISKSTAVARILKAKELKGVRALLGKTFDDDKLQNSIITLSTTIDNEKQTFEFYEDMYLPDYNRILVINKPNFQ